MPPIYEYDCRSCRESFERFSSRQLSADNDDTKCDSCGNKASRVPSRANWIGGGKEVTTEISDIHEVEGAMLVNIQDDGSLRSEVVALEIGEKVGEEHTYHGDSSRN